MEIQHPSVAEKQLKEYLFILRKRKWIAFFFCLLVIAATVFFVYTATPIYKSTAKILIEKENPNIVDFQEVFQVNARQTDYYVTQYELLKSRTLAEKVIQKLDLEETPYFKDQPKPIDRFLKMLQIEPVRNSRLVEVSVLHPEPKEAAEIANVLVDAYIRQNLENKLQISQQASSWISERLELLQDKVYSSEKKLQEYKEKHRLINIPSLAEETVALQEMRGELSKLETLRAEYSKRYLEEHPKLIQVDNQISELKQRIQNEIDKTIDLNKVAIEYNQLKRELQSNTRVYEALLARLKEMTVTENLEASNVVIIDQAEVPDRPFKPRKLISLLLALIIGSIGGITAAFFIEYLDDSIKSPEEIEKYLHLPFLGLIPHFSPGKKESSEVFMLKEKHSVTSEAVRGIRTSILLSGSAKEPQVILVTSCGPSEGKTIVSTNLAVALAQQGKRTLIIDTDMRKPKQHRYFNESNTLGLSNCLINEEVQRAIMRTGVENLDALFAGPIPPNPAELLGSEKMKEIIDSVRKIYDFIILDSSPFMAVTDAVILSSLAGGVIFVANTKKAHRKALKRGKKLFDSLGARIIGVVMNQVKVEKHRYYYGTYHYYGYGKN